MMSAKGLWVWMVGTVGTLKSKDNGMSKLCRTIAIDLHVDLLAVFDFGIVNTHGLDRSLIRMNDLAVID